MTDVIKGKPGFQTTYKTLEKDIVKTLTENPVKTSTVKEGLIKLNKGKYKGIHYDWMKKTLLKMLEAGKISGVKDPDLGIWLWSRKEEEENE